MRKKKKRKRKRKTKRRYYFFLSWESEEEEAGARKPNAQGSLIRAGCVMACVCGVKASERVDGEEKRWLE